MKRAFYCTNSGLYQFERIQIPFEHNDNVCHHFIESDRRQGIYL